MTGAPSERHDEQAKGPGPGAARISRRDLIRGAAALGLGGSAVSALLAACGAAPTATALAPTAGAAATQVATSAPSGATVAAAATQVATTVTGAATQVAPTVAAAGTQVATAAVGAAAQPRRGGEVIIGTLGEAANINPFGYTETEGAWRVKMLFDQLVRLKPDTFEPKPALAKSWKIEGQTFTFTLDDRAKYSDGTDVTAEDVAFAMKGILAKATASPNRTKLMSIQGAKEYNEGTAQDVAGIKVVDPKTIAVTLTQPDASFLINMRYVHPVPAKTLEGKDLSAASKEPFFQRPVGAGPFKFVSWQVGGDFVADRNPNYFQQGKPYLDKFTHRTIPDSQSLVNALLSGDIDVSNYPSPAGANQLRANANLNVLVPPFNAPDGWEFNFKNPYLAKKEVRQAIAMSLDMKQFARDSLYGLGQEGVGPIAPGNYAFDKELKPIPFDLDRAKALIRQAGTPPGEIQFMVNKGNVLREDFLTYTQAQLDEIGIRVKPEVIEFATLIDRRSKKDFEVNGVTGGVTVDPNELADLLSTNGSANYQGYSNPRLDDLFVQARRELDIEKQKAIFKQVQVILMDDLPRFWAWYRPFLHVAKKRFTGYVDSADTGGIVYELENWSITG